MFQSPHSGVASPLDFCHFGRLNIDLERTAWPWKPMLRQRDDIVTALQRNPEPAFAIRRKGGDFAFVVLDAENCVRKRRRIGNIGSGSNRSGTSWAHRDHSFDSRTVVRFNLSERHASVRNKECEKEAQLCRSCHRIRFLISARCLSYRRSRSLANYRIDFRIDPDGLARHHHERLRSGTNTFLRPPEHIENVIASIPAARCARQRIRYRSSCRHEPSRLGQS